MKTILRGLTPLALLAVLAAVPACGGDDSSATGTAGAGGTGGGSGGSGGSSGSGGGSDSGAADSGEVRITGSMGDWVVYADAIADGGTPNPLTGMTGTVDAYSLPGGKLKLKLSVKGLPPNSSYGSHLHKLACNDTKAGGHYQDKPFPPDSGATDPAYANDKNEAWLDFMTDATGAGSSERIVDWLPRAGEAKAVMIHAMPTATGGTAGAKLACANVPF